MKKITYTKFVMAVMLLCNLALLVFLCVMMWRTGDLSPAPYMAVGESGAIGVWLAAYAWKEKAANKSKYAMEYVDKIAAQHGPETAIRIAEIVLQD